MGTIESFILQAKPRRRERYEPPSSSATPPIEAAAGFVEELKGRGVRLYATEEGKLRFRPRSALSPEEVKRLKEYKGEILGLLGYRENLSSPIVLSSPSPTKADSYADPRGTIRGDDTPETTVPPFVKKGREHRQRSALELGLIARWARDRGYVSLHDPVSGEWYDVTYQDCPGWAKREAGKRSALRKAGDCHLYTREEFEALLEEERQEASERTDASDAITEKGIVYADYLPDEE